MIVLYYRPKLRDMRYLTNNNAASYLSEHVLAEHVIHLLINVDVGNTEK